MKTMNPKKSLVEARPDLAAQWHPTKNGNLKPEDVAPDSSKKVWWRIWYEGGKTFVEWQDAVARRVEGAGCPDFAGLPGRHKEEER